ncbi:hypothetical protein RI367_005710 [Sorochytrium milnesiophthora]
MAGSTMAPPAVSASPATSPVMGSKAGLPRMPDGQILSLAVIMANKAKSPYSLAEFTTFLRSREHSDENLDFIQALAEYTQLYQLHQDECRDNKTLLDERVAGEAENLINQFFLETSKRELNCVGKTRATVVEEVMTKKNYHPSVFDMARNKILELMRTSSLPHFVRYVNEANKDGRGGSAQ